MDELLNKISNETGVPTDLLDRAVRARAAAAGVSVEALAAEWAGEPVPEGGGAAAPPPAPETPAAAPPPAEPAEPKGPVVEVLEPTAEPPSPTSEPEPEPEPVGATTNFPRWLSAAFLIIPLLAVSYALLAPNGPNCGTSGALAIDPVTGEAANCDGSPYGVDAINFFTLGETLYEGKCASCHGSAGQGGTGPALAGGSVVVVFPSCEEHVEWIRVGTNGWTEATGRTTYGATEKPVGGSGAIMPGFASLTEAELREVTLYERVAFGQEAYDAAETGCGLTDPALAAG
jgi:hypothetical protein